MEWLLVGSPLQAWQMDEPTSPADPMSHSIPPLATSLEVRLVMYDLGCVVLPVNNKERCNTSQDGRRNCNASGDAKKYMHLAWSHQTSTNSCTLIVNFQEKSLQKDSNLPQGDLELPHYWTLALFWTFLNRPKEPASLQNGVREWCWQISPGSAATWCRGYKFGTVINDIPKLFNV